MDNLLLAKVYKRRKESSWLARMVNGPILLCLDIVKCTKPCLTQLPKVFGVKFSLREIGRIFSIKIRNFKLWKMPKLLNLKFLGGGDIF